MVHTCQNNANITFNSFFKKNTIGLNFHGVKIINLFLYGAFFCLLSLCLEKPTLSSNQITVDLQSAVNYFMA